MRSSKPSNAKSTGIRRQYRRQRRVRGQSAVTETVRRTTGLPDTLRVRLHYSELVEMTSANDIKNYIFRGNSLYDPNYTGVGHQPLYYDTYTSMYQKYRVLGSKITCKFINNTSQCAAVAVIVPNTDALNVLNYASIRELPRSKATPPIPVSARYAHTFSSIASTRQVCGISSAEQWDEEWAGTSGSNPSQVWYWNIFMTTMVPNFTLLAQMQVDIIYDAIFYDKIFIAQSLKLPDEKNSREKKSKETRMSESLPAVNLVQVVAPVLSTHSGGRING